MRDTLAVPTPAPSVFQPQAGRRPPAQSIDRNVGLLDAPPASGACRPDACRSPSLQTRRTRLLTCLAPHLVRTPTRALGQRGPHRSRGVPWRGDTRRGEGGRGDARGSCTQNAVPRADEQLGSEFSKRVRSGFVQIKRKLMSALVLFELLVDFEALQEGRSVLCRESQSTNVRDGGDAAWSRLLTTAPMPLTMIFIGT